jgi:hypothetical protein
MAGIPAGVFLVVGLLSLLFAWELWRLARWAFWASVIISLANSVITFTQPKANDGAIVAGMIFPNMILFYFLFDSNLRAAFYT